jgi:hypothetical protein
METDWTIQMANMVLGSDLSPSVKREALARFINRYTGDHKPDWVKRATSTYLYPVQFRDDEEWLANTRFAVTAKGELDRRIIHCESTPTWPEGNVPKRIENLKAAGK